MTWWIIGIGVYIAVGIGSFLWALCYRKLFEEETKKGAWGDILAMAPFIVLAAPPLWGSLLVWDSFVSLYSFTKGAFAMRRMAMVLLMTWASGFFTPNIYDRVTKWWSAPPSSPPSLEAQQLIWSLECDDGWKPEKSPISKAACVSRKSVSVEPQGLTGAGYEFYCAKIYINGSDFSDQFSRSDRQRINDAAAKCMRKATCTAIGRSSPTPPSTPSTELQKKLEGSGVVMWPTLDVK